MLFRFFILAISFGLSACGYPMSPTQLAVVSIPDDSAPLAPDVCDLRVREGQFVSVLRTCDGNYFFLPYELSSDGLDGLSTTSLELKGTGISIFLIDLSISSGARAEVSKFASSLGVRSLAAYPINSSSIVPSTFFDGERSFRVSIKENSSGSRNDISRTLVIQVVGAQNVQEFSQFLRTTNAFTGIEYVALPIAGGTTETISIQLRAGNLIPTNLTR